MPQKPNQDRTLTIDGEKIIMPECSVMCNAFEFCIQPHLCERYEKCIWSSGEGVNDDK